MWRRTAVAALVAGCATAGSGPVTIPNGDTPLQAGLALPAGPVRGPAVVALHGCGGLAPERSRQWEGVLNGAGHAVVFPDSFGSRGVGSQCRNADRAVRAGVERRQDAWSTAEWLHGQPYATAGVVLVGWSNGGSTALAAAARPRPGLLRGIVAFYPGCQTFLERANWAPAVPILILIGDADDWTPAEPCRKLAQRFPDRISITTYPGAYHGFDSPNRPVVLRRGLAFTADGSGTAHVGTNPAARADAMARVPGFIAGLP